MNLNDFKLTERYSEGAQLVSQSNRSPTIRWEESTFFNEKSDSYIASKANYYKSDTDRFTYDLSCMSDETNIDLRSSVISQQSDGFGLKSPKKTRKGSLDIKGMHGSFEYLRPSIFVLS